MTVKKSTPWKSMLFVLLLSIGSFFIYDININGGWKTSKSVRTLKDIGVWEYGEKTWDKANQGLNWTRQRIEEYAPGYLDSAAIAMQPYAEVTRDLGFVLYNVGNTYRLMIIEKTPYVFEFIEKHAPGLLEQCQEFLKTAILTTVEYWNKGYDYVTTEVFVGQLSPENMQKVIMQTFSSAQKHAVEYYHWVYEKIETTINGK